jgi:hypothetical protein
MIRVRASLSGTANRYRQATGLVKGRGLGEQSDGRGTRRR